MITKPRTKSELVAEIAELQKQLSEANDTLRAIRQGEIDAFVLDGPAGNRIYTLQTADHSYRVLVQQMNESAVILTTEGFVLYANATFSALISVSHEELISSSIQSLVSPEHQPIFEAALARAAAGDATRTEMTFLARHGERIPALLSLAPLNLEIVQGVCGIVTDLRERRKAEEVERAQFLVRSILDHATAVVVITDRDGKIAHANAAAQMLAERILPESAAGPRSILSEPFLNVFPLEIQPSAATGAPASAELLLEAALSGSIYRNIEGFIQSGSGDFVNLLLSAGPFQPVEGEIQGAVFTFSDVSAMREAQRSLRQSEQRFRDLAESIPQLVWTTNAAGRMDYCNTRTLEYFGKTLEELVREQSDLIHPDDVSNTRTAWLEALEADHLHQTECRLLSKDGSYHWFLVRAVPVRGADGKIVQWFGTSTNVDVQKYVEDQLRRANSDLEQFAYAASHDFQEPLRTVTIYSELLEQNIASQLDGEASAYLQYVLQGGKRMEALLESLIAYTRARRDYEADVSEVECDGLLREVLASFGPAIEESGAQITAQPLPRVRFARVHMVQLFQNLISNAIKYRGPEPPRIAIAAENRAGEWVFSFRDNGMGIAPEHQGSIFGVFKRLHGSSIPGSGIGLAICQRILEQYRGRIWVESQANQGSVFYFAFPAVVSQTVHA